VVEVVLEKGQSEGGIAMRGKSPYVDEDVVAGSETCQPDCGKLIVGDELDDVGLLKLDEGQEVW
jgi:hypothetical protein